MNFISGIFGLKLLLCLTKYTQSEANGSVIEKKYATKGANVKTISFFAGSEESDVIFINCGY